MQEQIYVDYINVCTVERKNNNEKSSKWGQHFKTAYKVKGVTMCQQEKRKKECSESIPIE